MGESEVGAMSIEHAPVEDREHHQQLRDHRASRASDLLSAGDTVLLRPKLVDCHDNPAEVTPGALAISVEGPPGTDTTRGTSMKPIQKGGLVHYEIRHTTVLAGKHRLHLMHNGEPLQGSPISPRFNDLTLR